MRPIDKIIVKGSAKQYKSGPRLTKRARLYQSLVRLQLAAARLTKQADLNDAMWAACLVTDLRPLIDRYGSDPS